MKSQISRPKQPLLFRNYSFVDDRLIQEEQQFLIETLKQKIKKRQKNRKVAAASPFGVDITQFFEFKKKQLNFQQTFSISSETSLISQLSGGYSAWLILGYCMFNNSLVLPWMISINADKFLCQAWRHIFWNMVLIPFILFEKRTANEQKKLLYKFKNILKIESLKNAFLVAFSKALWFVIIIASFKYTTVAHALILGSLMNFFLSINRFFSNSYHFLEPGGQIFTIFGIFLIMKDEVLLDPDTVDQNYSIISFKKYDWEFRLVIDMVTLFMSFVMAQFSQYTSNLNKDYPSYLGLSIVNFMVAILLFAASFFLHGATFDTNQHFGIFGVFTDQNFNTFFQLSIFIGFGMLWSSAMISKIFPQPLIPSLSVLFQPMISLMIVDFVGYQQIPSGYTVMGYIFIIPGTFLILIGQNAYQKIQQAQEIQIQERLKSLVELSRNLKQSQMNQIESPVRNNHNMPKSPFKKKNYSEVRSFDQGQMDDQFNQKQNILNLQNISCYSEQFFTPK